MIRFYGNEIESSWAITLRQDWYADNCEIIYDAHCLLSTKDKELGIFVLNGSLSKIREKMKRNVDEKEIALSLTNTLNDSATQEVPVKSMITDLV